GKILKEDLPVSLPWYRLFNTHIGVFGNTGSGKSNTLTNLYTALFVNKCDRIRNKSQFVVIDFNGEYTKGQLIDDEKLKTVYELDTKSDNGKKFPLSEDAFWDEEVFGILFKATENTQVPFLKRVVSGYKKYRNRPDSLRAYTVDTIRRALTSTSPRKEFSENIRENSKIYGNEPLERLVDQISWHGYLNKFHITKTNNFLDGGDNDGTYINYFQQCV